MNTLTIRNETIKFLETFDSLTRAELEKRQEWELTNMINEHGRNPMINFDANEKIEWLTKNNSNPFRKFAIELRNELVESHDTQSINMIIENMTNGRFLDSIGVPGKSKYSKIIMDFVDKLNGLK